MDIKKQTQAFYRIRPYPGRVDRFLYFKQHNIIALGWSKIGNVTGMDRSQIIKRLQESYPATFENKTRASGLTAGYFLKFNMMREGDIVLIPYDNEIIKIVEVVKPYQFVEKLIGNDMAHVVVTKPITQVLSKELSTDLLGSVNSRATLITLDKYRSKIQDLITRVPWEISKEDLTHYIGITANKKITLGITPNVTKQELLDFVNRLDLL